MADSYDSDTLAQLNDPSGEIDAFIREYQDTPPTSPVTGGSQNGSNKMETLTASFQYTSDKTQQAASHSSSPVASSHSSPSLEAYHTPDLTVATHSENFSSSVFDWGAIDPQPSLCGGPNGGAESVFSPPGVSSSGSELDGSTNTYDQDTFGRDKNADIVSLEQLLDLDNAGGFDDGYQGNYAANLLESWLSAN